MTKPDTRINSAEQPEKLNAKGLDGEIVTKHQLKKGLRLVLGVDKGKEVKMLSVKEAQGMLNVKIAIPRNIGEQSDVDAKIRREEIEARLKVALGDLTDTFTKGTVTGKRATNNDFPYILVGVNTLECKVAPERKYELYKALATFINEEAARQPKANKILEKLAQLPPAPEMQRLG